MLNIPNSITLIRLCGSIVLFALLGGGYHDAALVVFLLAAGTDWLDGYVARRLQQVTVLGRILDPFVDKLLVCGTFTYLVAEPASEVQPWMAVVVLGREMLVTALRSFLEQRAADFSATWSGKLKMVLQIVALTGGLWLTARAAEGSVDPLAAWCVRGLCWLAMLSTVHSGVEYIFRAMHLLSATRRASVTQRDSVTDSDSVTAPDSVTRPDRDANA